MHFEQTLPYHTLPQARTISRNNTSENIVKFPTTNQDNSHEKRKLDHHVYTSDPLSLPQLYRRWMDPAGWPVTEQNILLKSNGAHRFKKKSEFSITELKKDHNFY